MSCRKSVANTRQQNRPLLTQDMEWGKNGVMYVMSLLIRNGLRCRSLLWRHIENKIKNLVFKASIDDDDGADKVDLRYFSRAFYVECEYNTNFSQK